MKIEEEQPKCVAKEGVGYYLAFPVYACCATPLPVIFIKLQPIIAVLSRLKQLHSGELVV